MGVVASSSMQCLESPTAVKVRMISLDDYAAQARVRPDLLKIDVEGFEVEVLKGAGSCLATAHYVILECHSEELTRQCQAILAGAGFRTALEGALLFAQTA